MASGYVQESQLRAITLLQYVLATNGMSSTSSGLTVRCPAGRCIFIKMIGPFSSGLICLLLQGVHQADCSAYTGLMVPDNLPHHFHWGSQKRQLGSVALHPSACSISCAQIDMVQLLCTA